MKCSIIILIILIVCGLTYAQETPDWAWAVRAGGTGSNFGHAIATDNSGNSYVTGYFKNTAMFGTTELTALGNQDVIVAKYDSNGALLWVSQAGGTGQDIGSGIALDAAGNIYITGYIDGTSLFGSTELVCSDTDAFVAKLDSNGTWLWAAKNVGGGHNYAHAIATDNLGNSYITGEYKYTATFGDASITAEADYDVFVACISANGDWIWASTNQGWSEDIGQSIAKHGNFLYVTGHTKGSDFGPYNVAGNGSQIFVAKISQWGTWSWAVGAGGSSSDYGHAIQVDNSGYCWVTGYFSRAASFSGISVGLSTNNYAQIFVGRVSPEGLWTEVHTVTQSTRSHGNAIALDASGHVYITGYFMGDVSFGDHELINAGGEDIFVAKLNVNGTWDWASPAGGSTNYYDKGLGIALDGNGSCYITGCFTGTGYFGDTQLVSPGNEDIFIAKHSGATTDVGSLEAPITVIDTQDSQIKLTWDAIDGATVYLIYASDTPDPENWGEPIGQSSTLIYFDSPSLSKRFYRVVASSE